MAVGQSAAGRGHCVGQRVGGRRQVDVSGGTTDFAECLSKQAGGTRSTGLFGIDVDGPVDRHDEVVPGSGGGHVQESDGLGILESAVDLVGCLEAWSLDACSDADLDRSGAVHQEIDTPVGPRRSGRHAGQDGDGELQALGSVDGQYPDRSVVDLREDGLCDPTLLVGLG